ncbi:putative sodium-coupled neutral amino acid transporter 7 [Galendromus occidentalis]|uniref:Sodium-coupled neutral amino acid transporter 7 n=1 Tax=Galendromus occidentalis TaxID=34638 RepID=A0AAJ7SFA5_9ACAR|nr:putative sodium-coupled neutral amino acid transporter 7 [Galendromus occidentalis]
MNTLQGNSHSVPLPEMVWGTFSLSNLLPRLLFNNVAVLTPPTSTAYVLKHDGLNTLPWSDCGQHQHRSHPFEPQQAHFSRSRLSLCGDASGEVDCAETEQLRETCKTLLCEPGMASSRNYSNWALHNSGMEASLKSGYMAEDSCETTTTSLAQHIRQRSTSARQFLSSYNSSIEYTTYLNWHTLSSDLSEKIRQGSLRVNRNNAVEYATIDEERAHGDKVPLLRRVQSTNVQGISWGVAAFLLVNTALGAGVLNYPSAYDKAGGVLTATIIQIIMMFSLSVTMMVLAYCSDVKGDCTYHDVLMTTVGRKAQQLAAASILVTCYGVSITFLIIIGDQYDRLFLSLFGDDFCQNVFLSREFTIAVTSTLFILPICYFQRLDFLKYASSLGIFAMLYPVFLTIYVYYTQDVQPVFREISPDSPQSFMEFISIVPVICFAYQTHEVLLPIYANMRERNINSLVKTTSCCMLMLFVIYSAMGTYGYLTFGSGVKPDIMQMFDGQRPEVLIGIAALIIKMITSYPLIVICGRGAFDGLYAEIFKIPTEEFIANEKRRRIIITTLWFVTTTTLAVTLSNIGVVIELLGCLACVNVFVFPGLCLVGMYCKRRHFGLNYPNMMLAGGIILIVMGTGLFPLVLYESIRNWTSGSGHHLLCTH